MVKAILQPHQVAKIVHESFREKLLAQELVSKKIPLTPRELNLRIPEARAHLGRLAAQEWSVEGTNLNKQAFLPKAP